MSIQNNLSQQEAAHVDRAAGDRHGQGPAYDPRPGSRWLRVARGRFSVVALALTVMLLIWLGCQLVGVQILHLVWGDATVPEWLELVISNGPLYLIAMPVAWLVLRSIPVLPTRQFPLGQSRFWVLLIMCVPIMYAGNFVGSLLSDALSQGQAINQIAELAAQSDPLTSLVFMVIVAPIFEEWTFRKQIIDHVRRYGEKPAILLSALAFGLFHMNLFQFFYAFGLGLIFGYVYVRTSRLRYSLAMHMLVNLNGGVVAPFILSLLSPDALKGIESESPALVEKALQQNAPGMAAYGLYALILLTLFIAGIVLLIRHRRHFEFYITPEELPRGTRFRTVFLNPGFIVYLALCIAVGAVQFLL